MLHGAGLTLALHREDRMGNIKEELNKFGNELGMNICLIEESLVVVCEAQTHQVDTMNAPIKDAILDAHASSVPSNQRRNRGYHNYYTSRALKTYTRAELKHCIAGWPPRQQPSPPTGGIALAGKDLFPPAFAPALDMANTTNICGLDDALISEAFWGALLEREASRQYRFGSNTHIQKFLDIKEGYARDDMTVSGEVGTDNELHWNLNRGIAKGTSWRDLLRMIFNLSRMDALATLASVLGMSFDNLSRLSSDRHDLELKWRIAAKRRRACLSSFVWASGWIGLR